MISDELSKRLEEIRQLEATRLSLERELTELRPLRSRLQEAMNDLSHTKGSQADREQEFIRRIRLMDDLEL